MTFISLIKRKKLLTMILRNKTEWSILKYHFKDSSARVLRMLRACSPVFWKIKSETYKLLKFETRKFWKFWLEKWNFLNLELLDRNFFSNVYFDKVGIDFEFWRSEKTVSIGLDSYLDLKNHKFSISEIFFCIPLCAA